MAQKALLIGDVTRVAKLTSPTRMEFTLNVISTKVGTDEFTIGTDVNIEVGVFTMQKESIRTAMMNLSTGDKVNVEMEKNEEGKWEVSDMKHFPKRGRPVGEFLDDVEEEIANRQNKKS